MKVKRDGASEVLIGELSHRTGVAAHLLRYYEARGLLSPVRGANGYRDYADDAVEIVGQIRGLLEAGLSTEDLGFLLPCATGTVPELEPCDELLEVLQARLDRLDQRVDALTNSRRALHRYLTDTAARRMSRRGDSGEE